MSNAKNRTDVTMVTGPVICGRCGVPMSPLVIEEIAGLSQLRAGNVLIPLINANCLQCGWTFKWYVNEKNIEKMTTTYQQVLQRYSPE